MASNAMAESYMTALRSFVSAPGPALNKDSKDIAICFLPSAEALAARGKCPSASELSSSPPFRGCERPATASGTAVFLDTAAMGFGYGTKMT